MRLSIFAFIFVFVLSAPSWAAEIGTYRPGQPYASISAQHPNQCLQQCLGDAQCKGWNFVKVRPQQGLAICEFNARKVTPIPSAISISGDNPTALSSNRLVPAGYRTTRVGQNNIVRRARPDNTMRVGAVPSAPANRVSAPPIIAPAPQKATAPQAMDPRTANLRTPQPPQMRFQHSLESRPAQIAAPAPQMPMNMTPPRAPRPTQAPETPRFQPMLDDGPRSHAAASVAGATPTISEINDAPIAQRQQPAQRAPEYKTASEISRQAPRRAVDPSLVGAPVGAPKTGHSLFGSLYDDVKAPKALRAEDIPLDPDAPISTVTSVPVARIQQSPL